MYAPTTIAPARDFCTLRYTCVQEDGGIVVRILQIQLTLQEFFSLLYLFPLPDL